MKTSRQNDKNLTRLPAQIIMLLIISAVLLTGCKNTTDIETLSETVDADLGKTNEPVESINSEVTATDGFIEDKNVSMQPDQTAIPCSAPILTIETAFQTYYWDGEALNILYDEVSISGDGFETVAQAVSEWNQQDIEQIDKLKGYVGYTNELSSFVDCNRIDNSVVSFKQRWHDQDGFIDYRGINFDVASGRKLALADILVDEDGFNEKAIEIAVEKLQEIPDADKLPLGYEIDVAHEFNTGIIDLRNQWYLDAYGIVYIYSNFEDTVWHGYIPNHHEDIPEEDDERTVVNSDLPGDITVTIPYEEVAEYMKPAYCGIQDVGVAEFSVNETVHINLSNKRVSEKTSYEKSSGAESTALDTILITIDETDSINEISITINNRKETFETYAWMQDAYLLCQKNGSTYLLFDTSYGDHDGITYLYDITNGGITKKEELEFTRIIKPVNANSFILDEYMTAFGNYFGYGTYMIDESTGKLLYPEIYYTDAGYDITLIRELPVVIYGEETTLPPGTPLQVTALSYDSGTAYFFESNDGLAGELYFTLEDGTIYIDGLEESYYFDIEYGG